MIKEIKQTLLYSARFTYQNKMLVFLYWATNLGFALVLTFPLFTLLKEELQYSAINSHFAAEFDFLWYIQFLTHHDTMVNVIPGLVISIALLYNLIQLFYTGGFLAIAAHPQKNHIVDFFFGGVRYFYRFVAVYLVTILLYFVIISINSLLVGIGNRLFADSQSTLPEFFFHFARYTLFLFWIVVVNVVADYSKVAIASKDESNLIRAAVKAFLFVKDNFALTISIFLILASFVSAAALAYNFVDGFIPKDSWYLIIATFFIQQMLIIFRLIIRMQFYASEYYIYNDLTAEPVRAYFEEINKDV
ncbi:MAG: hypothetical protein HYV28_01690 [Ignavibacteriales bacterium]|nr:hypothetical protein [Ignavibacteriales bacterium]